ncbi:MAG TPA: dethiobiotin synthase [Planctomycetaceae bacterium]|nr:dethiobiotin synthase [Planctomycetaceae bacterium]
MTTGLFVKATDTGVGKTYLTALIARSLREIGVPVGAYKPVCSGAEIAPDGTVSWADVRTLAAAIGGDFDAGRVCPQRLRAPLAPPVAAKMEGVPLDFDGMQSGAAWWEGRVDVLLVEGVGGLLCPLTEEQSIADLAVALAYPLLVVARLGLGTINHTLLTVEAARQRGLRVAGVVLNEAEPPTSAAGTDENASEIARRANVPVLGVVRHGSRHVEQAQVRFGPVEWMKLMAPRDLAQQ